MRAFPRCAHPQDVSTGILGALGGDTLIIYFASRFTYYLDNLATPPGQVATWGCGAEPAKAVTVNSPLGPDRTPVAERVSQPNPPDSSVPDLSGDSIGRFQIVERVGRGGMGEVYRAYDTQLKRTVAVKRIIRPADENYRKRLLTEARFASQLTDPRIAAVYDVFEHHGELFMVMEYVDGQTLRQRMDEPLSIGKFLEIGTECAEALAAAHRLGVLHRDIKPENIMLTLAGQVKILDFGVAARLPNSSINTTQIDDRVETKAFSGTVAYMAPEVLQENAVDERSDIFSLGVIFYEALAGRHPFYAKGFLATSNRIVNDEPAPLRTFNSRVSPELERIVTKMLAKNPGQRYVTASDLLVDLRALQRTMNRTSAAAPLVSVEPRSRWMRMLVVLLATVIVGAAAAMYLGKRVASAPVFAARDWLLITDFENHSGEQLFDETVAESLGHALQQSRYVDIVPRSQALAAAKLTGRSDVTHLDAELARQICQRENYHAFLAGDVVRAGVGYRIDVRVVDPLQNASVLRDSVSLQNPSQLYVSVDELAARLRRRLGESVAQIERQSTPQAQVTTPSLEALRRYSAGMKRYAAGDVDGFLVLAKTAIELDPNFAMAHLSMADAYNILGNENESRLHLVQAVKGVDRVSERERYLIRATDYSSRLQGEKALEQYRMLVELYPDDVDGLRGLAEESMVLERRQDAIQAQKRVLQIDPHNSRDQNLLIRWLARDNKPADALAAYSFAKDHGANSVTLHWGAGLAYLGQDEPEKAQQEFDALAQEGGEYEKALAALYSARVLIYRGKLTEATDALRTSMLLDEKLHNDTWVPVNRYLLIEVLRLRGRLPEARVESRKLTGAVPQAGYEDAELRWAGVVAVRMGDLATSRQLLTHLEKLKHEHDNNWTSCYYYNLKGIQELAEGRTNAAIESQQHAIVANDFYGASDAMAAAYAAQSRWPDAVTFYKRYLDEKGAVLADDSPSDWVLANLRVAQSLEQAGDLKESLKYYDTFLRLWADADPDLSVLHLAKDGRARVLQAISSKVPEDTTKR
jgi:tetratricopeptide (TPR) repeat protein/tRNA A-37 threonylcarbamoyl transferase component Bud32